MTKSASGESREVYRLIKRLHILASQRIDELLREHNLARSQFQVLYLVNDAGELAGKELLEKLAVEPATLSGIIDTLEVKGWLVRLEDPDDRRARIIRLTVSGRRLMESIPNPAAQVEKQMLSKFSSSEKFDLKQKINLMINNLERK